MKNTKISELALSDPDTLSDEMLPEYQFDYSKAQPNRFAERMESPKKITLDSDVAAVFTTDEAVNTILRALIEAMPQLHTRQP